MTDTDEIVIQKTCLWCRQSFEVKELHPIEIHNAPIKFYICDECLKKNPDLKIQVPLEE